MSGVPPRHTFQMLTKRFAFDFHTQNTEARVYSGGPTLFAVAKGRYMPVVHILGNVSRITYRQALSGLS